MFFSTFLADYPFGAFRITTHVLTQFLMDFAFRVDEIATHFD